MCLLAILSHFIFISKTYRHDTEKFCPSQHRTSPQLANCLFRKLHASLAGHKLTRGSLLVQGADVCPHGQRAAAGGGGREAVGRRVPEEEEEEEEEEVVVADCCIYKTKVCRNKLHGQMHQPAQNLDIYIRM